MRKTKIRADYNSKALWKYFLQINNLKPKNIPYLTYNKIIFDFFKLLIIEIYKGFIFDLPYKMGRIGISTKQQRVVFDENGEFNFLKSNLAIDHKSTKELWDEYPELKYKKYIYYTNEHTDGKKYKIKWLKNKYIRNMSVYAFKPCRSFSRNLNKHLLENPKQEYYDL